MAPAAAAATASPQAPPPTLPPSLHALLSPATYLAAHLGTAQSSFPPRRPNGRLPAQFSPLSITTSSLTHAHGSAVVRDASGTAVVCAVRGEVLPLAAVPEPPPLAYTSPSSNTDTRDGNDGDGGGQDWDEDGAFRAAYDAEIAGLGLLVLNVELSTGCSPQHVPGSAPPPAAQALTTRLLALLHGCRLVDPADLRIVATAAEEEGDVGTDEGEGEGGGEGAPDAAHAQGGEEGGEVKAYWTLHLDLHVLSLATTPPHSLPTLLAALLAALRSTSLPHTRWSARRGAALSSPDPARALPLRVVGGWPVAAAFGVFEAPADGAGDSGSVGAAAGKEGRKGGGRWRRRMLLADPDALEAGLCAASLCATVDCSGAASGGRVLRRLERGAGQYAPVGSAAAGADEAEEAVRLATGRWAEVKQVIEEAVARGGG